MIRTSSCTEKALILRVFKHNESDLVVHGMNSSGQKIHLMAKGALKSRKRFGGGVLDPTHYVRWTYDLPRGDRDMGHLREAYLVDDFSGLRSQYDRIELALHFVKIMDRLSLVEGLDSASLFHLLGQGLRAAETASNLEKLRIHFELKVLHHQGILPPLVGAEKFLLQTLRENDAVEFSLENSGMFKREVSRQLGEYLGGR